MKRQAPFRNILLAAASLCLASSAHASVIYFDDFTTGSTAALNGQFLLTPDTTAWTATNVNKSTVTGTANSAGGDGRAFVAAPTFNPGDLIQLTARVGNTSTGSGWVALGYSTAGNGIASNGAAGRNWITWRGDNVLRVHGTNAGVVFGSDLSFTQAGEGNLLDLRILYDVDANTMTYFFKNPSDTSWTEFYSATPVGGIGSVGFAHNVNNTSVHFFEVINVPEPSTAMLVVLGFLGLLRRRR